MTRDQNTPRHRDRPRRDRNDKHGARRITVRRPARFSRTGTLIYHPTEPRRTPRRALPVSRRRNSRARPKRSTCHTNFNVKRRTDPSSRRNARGRRHHPRIDHRGIRPRRVDRHRPARGALRTGRYRNAHYDPKRPTQRPATVPPTRNRRPRHARSGRHHVGAVRPLRGRLRIRLLLKS